MTEKLKPWWKGNKAVPRGKMTSQLLTPKLPRFFLFFSASSAQPGWATWILLRGTKKPFSTVTLKQQLSTTGGPSDSAVSPSGLVVWWLYNSTKVETHSLWYQEEKHPKDRPQPSSYASVQIRLSISVCVPTFPENLVRVIFDHLFFLRFVYVCCTNDTLWNVDIVNAYVSPSAWSPILNSG